MSALLVAVSYTATSKADHGQCCTRVSQGRLWNHYNKAQSTSNRSTEKLPCSWQSPTLPRARQTMVNDVLECMSQGRLWNHYNKAQSTSNRSTEKLPCSWQSPTLPRARQTMVNDVLECHRGGSGTTIIRLRAQATVPQKNCLVRGSLLHCHEQGKQWSMMY